MFYNAEKMNQTLCGPGWATALANGVISKRPAATSAPDLAVHCCAEGQKLAGQGATVTCTARTLGAEKRIRGEEGEGYAGTRQIAAGGASAVDFSTDSTGEQRSWSLYYSWGLR